MINQPIDTPGKIAVMATRNVMWGQEVLSTTLPFLYLSQPHTLLSSSLSLYFYLSLLFISAFISSFALLVLFSSYFSLFSFSSTSPSPTYSLPLTSFLRHFASSLLSFSCHQLTEEKAIWMLQPVSSQLSWRWRDTGSLSSLSVIKVSPSLVRHLSPYPPGAESSNVEEGLRFPHIFSDWEKQIKQFSHCLVLIRTLCFG